MSKFKLLAIRPLKGCDKGFLKNLTSGQIYPLYNNYSFHDVHQNKVKPSSNDVVHYISINSHTPEIYNTKTADGHNLDISISAIAGKNGSGKSSLVELFFACIYLYCANKNILEPNIKSLERSYRNLQKNLLNKDKQQLKVSKSRDEIIKELENLNAKISLSSFNSIKSKIKDFEKLENDMEEKNSIANSQLKQITQQQNEINEINQRLKAEIYYQIDDQFYSLYLNYDKNNDKQDCEIFTLSDLKDPTLRPRKLSSKTEEFGKYFFYTIAINYSHYALNSLHIGDWITSLFHKNDGYKTPIVISPMRTNGNFNINSEINFAKYRLLTNKLQEYNSGNRDRIYIAENHFIDKVIFTLNWNKVDAIPKKVRFRMNKMYGTPRDINMLQTFLALYLNTEEQITFGNDFALKQIVSNYLINKINSIPEKYPWFGKGYHFSPNSKHLQNDHFFQLLKNDKSHVTYKLKQTINFLKRSLNNNDGFKISKEQLERRSNVRFELTLETLMEWMGNQSGREIMAHLPPSLFDIDFKLTNGIDSNYLFSALSSGEQQLVHTIQSVIYHLNNIQSAHLGEGERYKYNNVNIIYDEIELYFHPDYQRRFIADLLKEFERFYIGGNTGIESLNIVLLTHSPFILSDIPSNNIMLLDANKKSKKTVPKIAESQTFAANINELLADGFFLRGTLIGKHAENRITEAIDNIKNDKLREIDTQLFNMVGDSFLKTSLENFKKRQDDQDTNK